MFQVLRSSAGAGKTHALVKHYLTHCLGTSDHGAYRHVLALTFTNKAAAEMKDRVISYLEGLAGGGPYNGPLGDVADHLRNVNGIDAEELARRAHVVLGHLPEEVRLAGKLELDLVASYRVVDVLAQQLGLSVEDCAEGILRIADQNMANAIRAVSSQRGHDPRQYTLVPFGGAGGLHAVRLAELLGMRRILLPASPGLLSAVGMLSKLMLMCPATTSTIILPLPL